MTRSDGESTMVSFAKLTMPCRHAAHRLAATAAAIALLGCRHTGMNHMGTTGTWQPTLQQDDAGVRPPRYRWRLTGPGGGGHYPLAGLAADGSRFVVTTDMGSCMVNRPGSTAVGLVPRRQFRALAFHPTRTETVLGSDYVHGLYRSADGGSTWTATAGAWLDYDRAGWDGTWPPPYQGPVAISFSLTEPDKAAAVFTNYHLARGRDAIFTSADAGRTWSLRCLPNGDAVGTVLSADFSAAEPGALLVAADTGLHRLSPGSTTLQRVCVWPGPGAPAAFHCGLRNGRLMCCVLIARNRKTRGKRLFISPDEGRTWEARTPDLGTGVMAVGLCRLQPQTAYFSVADDDNHWRLPENEKRRRNWITARLYRTDDAFVTWRPVLAPHPDMPDYNVEAPYWGEHAWGWHLPPEQIAVAAANPDIALRPGNTRVYLTHSGGQTWQNVSAPPLAPDGSQPGGGMPIMSAWGYHIDPHDRRRHVISMTDFSGWRSFDGGHSWFYGDPGNPFPHNWYDMIFDPAARGRLWAAAARHHDLPHPKFNGSGLRQPGGCVITSADAGESWTPLGRENGLPNVAITDLELDPESPVGRRRLWAAALGAGLFVSHDAGTTWSKQDTGMDPGNPNVLRVRLDAHARLFALTTWVVPSRTPRPGALYISTDRGGNWSPLFRRDDTPYLWDSASDPHDPDILYVCAFTPRVRHLGGGLWRSGDGGTSWTCVLPDTSVATVTIDPADPSHLFACAFWDGLYESRDRGHTWSRLDSFPFQSPYKVVFDPHEPASVYVCCFGSSIWHGRATDH